MLRRCSSHVKFHLLPSHGNDHWSRMNSHSPTPVCVDELNPFQNQTMGLFRKGQRQSIVPYQPSVLQRWWDVAITHCIDLWTSFRFLSFKNIKHSRYAWPPSMHQHMGHLRLQISCTGSLPSKGKKEELLNFHQKSGWYPMKNAMWLQIFS